MLAIELCHDKDPRKPASKLTRNAVTRCRENGVLVLTAGPHGNVIRLLSPLDITDADLEQGLEVLEQSILAAAREHPKA